MRWGKVMWKEVSPAFEGIDEILSRFSVSSFNDPKIVSEYLSHFPIEELCVDLDVDRIESIGDPITASVSRNEIKPYRAEYSDLCRLHYLVLKRKVLTVLEFGSGYSTVVIASAMELLKEHFLVWAKTAIRVEHPFHVYAVEEDERFMEITQRRLVSGLSHSVTVQKSEVEMMLHDNRIASVYSELPNVSPDFIYLDGPSQFATTTELNGFSFGHRCRMPMSADILRFEYFLEPGTLILIDGRTANSRFLRAYLKREWFYEYDSIGDVHYLELREDPLGEFNQRKLDFCLGGRWLS